VKRVLLDTNVYVDWLNHGRHEALVMGRGLVRHMSSVVLMELRAGTMTRAAERAVDRLLRAYAAGDRLVTPRASAFERAGAVLRRLRASGREVRRASLVNDLFIALSASTIGATLVTRDVSDFTAIAEHVAVRVEPALDQA
jgi:predicted nucleic acid-binding protein